MKFLKKQFKHLENLKHRLLAILLSSKLLFILMGIASTLWFLVRVLPKPQRAGYPCMKAAAPIMSGFVLYLLSLGGMTLMFKSAVTKFKKAKYISAGLSLAMCLLLLIVFNWNDAQKAYSNTFGFTRGILPDAPNTPMGTGFGVFPGRVAWVRDVDATNENCTNVFAMKGSGWNKSIDWANSDVFLLAKNNNQDVINDMADKSVKAIGGQSTVKDSWETIFKSFNRKKTGTESGYTEGQTIFIKINSGQAGWAIDMSDLSEKGNSSSTGLQNIAMSNSTPATVLAYIRQLVDECGIPQNKIYVGEPMTHVYKSFYDLISASYPDVIILDKENHTNLGRTTTSGWHEDAIKYSDNGAEMPDAISDALMNEMYDADYMINMSALKAHARGGVTLTAKLHFGSHGSHSSYTWGSFYLHEGLICTVDNDVMTSGLRGDYGMYRVLTDIMGHEKLGLNTVLFVVDGLWGGIEATDMPVKWQSAPFNDDFPSSLFVSQDAVALESVCIDFLRAEADVNPDFKDRPFFPAVDDHLHQAADKANWANGITYDPEGDGTEMPASLGVHEHWNNDTDKKYTRNLGTGQGIELITINDVSTSKNVLNKQIETIKAYPNPCFAKTNLNFSLKFDSKVSISLFSMNGKEYKISNNIYMQSGVHNQSIDVSGLNKGIYVCRIKTVTNGIKNSNEVKLIIK